MTMMARKSSTKGTTSPSGGPGLVLHRGRRPGLQDHLGVAEDPLQDVELVHSNGDRTVGRNLEERRSKALNVRQAVDVDVHGADVLQRPPQLQVQHPAGSVVLGLVRNWRGWGALVDHGPRVRLHYAIVLAAML